MLKRIDAGEALFELLNGNENIYIKGVGEYVRALNCSFCFKEFREGYYFNDTKFYIEIEDEGEEV